MALRVTLKRLAVRLVLAIGIVVDDAHRRAGEHRAADGQGPAAARGRRSRPIGGDHAPSWRSRWCFSAGFCRAVSWAASGRQFFRKFAVTGKKNFFETSMYSAINRHDDDAVAGRDDLQDEQVGPRSHVPTPRGACRGVSSASSDGVITAWLGPQLGPTCPTCPACRPAPPAAERSSCSRGCHRSILR